MRVLLNLVIFVQEELCGTYSKPAPFLFLEPEHFSAILNLDPEQKL